MKEMRNKRNITKKEELDILRNMKQEIEEYIETIDDRNSIKIQTIKSDMQKILKRVYIRDNGGLNGNNQM